MTTPDAVALVSGIETLIDRVDGASEQKVQEISEQVSRLVKELPASHRYAGIGYMNALADTILEAEHERGN